MGDFCKVEADGGVLRVEIDRPHVLNALHPPANRELSDVFDRFERDVSLRVAIITGSGSRSFCAGNDLKYQAEGGDMALQPATGMAGLTYRRDMTKPVIAAVNGLAFGGGFEIVLACDIVVASETALFALPEVKVGMVPRSGIHRLARHAGTKWALGMILTGRRVAAADMQFHGVVNEVTSPDRLMSTAQDWADDIVAAAPVAARAAKQAMHEGLEAGGLHAALHGSYELVDQLPSTADFAEGPRAFAEGRAPVWVGS